MSFYRAILAAVAAVVIASPVFADDTTNATQSASGSNAAIQTSDNSGTANANASMSGDNSAMSAEQTKINLNKATAKELMKVKGMNASKARAIVAYRKKNGDFKSVDDLSNVKGFKKMNSDMMKEITDQLSVD